MTDVVVVGGGIMGLLAARELLRSGATVTLLEKNRDTGREASWAGGGIVSPLYPWRYSDAVTVLAQAAQQAYPALCAALASDTGIDPEYAACGLLMLDADDATQAMTWAAQHQQILQPWNSAQCATHEPSLTSHIEQGLWMPQIAQVRNPQLLQALRAWLATQHGFQLVTQAQVMSVDITQQRCTAVRTAQATYSADNVLITAGAWSSGLLAGLHAPLPIEPVRGQMLQFRTTPGLLRGMVLQHGKYVIPRRDGLVLVGSTLEYTGFDASTTAEAYAELYAAAVKMVPALAQCEVVGHWSGLRPAAPDGVPYISAHPTISNLFVCTGQFRNGLVLSPASVQLVCDLILARTPVCNPAPYAWYNADH